MRAIAGHAFGGRSANPAVQQVVTHPRYHEPPETSVERRVPASQYRILHVFRAPVGGLFRHVLDLARAQIERGHEVGIVCDATTGGARAEAALAAIEPSLALGLARLAMPRNPDPRDLGALVGLGRLCRARRPDVLHGHGAKGGFYARLARVGEGAPPPLRAYTPHGGSFHYQPGTLAHALYMGCEKYLAGRTEVFLFESEFVAERFKAQVGAARGVVRVNHNGLRPDEFDPIEPASRRFDLVYVGELRQLKGVDVLIDALAEPLAGPSRPTLLIVGAGPDEPEFRQRVAARGLDDCVVFAPPRPIRQALAQGKVMVVPSRAESLPYVVMEAAAAGQPMIATRVGGIPEIFGPFADRLLRPDDVAGLAGAIGAMLGASQGDRAVEASLLRAHLMERFSLARMADNALAAYEEGRSARSGRGAGRDAASGRDRQGSAEAAAGPLPGPWRRR